MSKRGRHLWKNGLRAGYTEYRYGSKPSKAPKRIFKGNDKDRVIRLTLRFLKTWRTTPFQHEATARAWLRSGLCLKGYGWERADFEAAAIVSECLSIMGAYRPTWTEGQWEYSATRTNCLRCSGHLDEADQLANRRFCSVECAKGLMLDRALWDDKQSYLAYQLAWKEHQDRSAPSRECKHCGKPFNSRVADRDYCSKDCAYEARRTLPDITCEECDTVFRPRYEGQTLCSQACAGTKRLREFRRDTPEQTCPVCKSVFRPSRKGQIYCSSGCSRSPAVRAMERQRAAAAVVRSITCDACGTQFKSKREDARFCSSACNKFHHRITHGWHPKRLSPPVFDYVFRRAA